MNQAKAIEAKKAPPVEEKKKEEK